MKKSLKERLAAKEAKLAREAAIVSAMKGRVKAAERKLDNRCKILVGAAVLGEMERTPQFAKFVRAMLDKAITRPHDRAAIEHLFPKPADAGAPASNANVPPATPAGATSTPRLSSGAFEVTAREKQLG